MVDKAKRIDVKTAREHLDSDEGALLVCGYDDAEKFEDNHLEGALSLDGLRAQEENLPKDREIIFYCD